MHPDLVEQDNGQHWKVWQWLEGHPERWCQGAYATDKNGERISCHSDNAVSRCVVGLLLWAYPCAEAYWDAAERIAKRIDFTNARTLNIWNDDPKRTFEEVYQVFKDENL